MKKILTISIFLVVSLFCNSVSAGEKETKVTDLTPWKGYSVSVKKLYEGEAGDKFFSAVKKYAPKGYTHKMVKDFFYNMFSLKFKSLRVVDKDIITIDDKISGYYAHIGKLTTKWQEYDITWEIFKTDSKEMIEAGYKYFLLIPFHQHSKDSLRHSHLRFGNQNFDFLATDPSVQSWWPTIYQPVATDEAKVMAAMIKGAKLQSSMLPPLKK